MQCCDTFSRGETTDSVSIIAATALGVKEERRHRVIRSIASAPSLATGSKEKAILLLVERAPGIMSTPLRSPRRGLSQSPCRPLRSHQKPTSAARTMTRAATPLKLPLLLPPPPFLQNDQGEEGIQGMC